jgi:MFS family permease
MRRSVELTGRQPALAPPGLCDAAHAQNAVPERPSSRNFALIAFTYGVVMTGVVLPTPLYVVYQKFWGFSASTLTIVFAAYVVGILATLILFRRTADRLGSKQMLGAGVLVAIASTAVFLGAQSVLWLVAARILSGASAGLVTSTAARGLTVFEPHGDRRRAAQWVTVLTAIGLGIGPFYSGILVQYGPDRLTLCFWVLLATLLVALLTALLVREHPLPKLASANGPGFLFRIPSEARGAFPITCLAAFIGMSLAGMFSGLAPSFLGRDLKISNLAIGGAIVLLVFCAAAGAQLALGRVDRKVSLRMGGALVPCGLASLATAVWTGLAGPFFLGAVVCGAGFGLCLMGGLGILNEVTPPESRGEVLSGFYVAAYAGLGIPVVAVGVLADAYGLPTAAVVLSTIIAILSTPVIAWRPLRAEPRPPAANVGTVASR